MDSIARMQKCLTQDYKRQDWHLSLRAGPEALGVLGQCQLVSTRSEMMSISLSGPGLEYHTLHGNINCCVQMGIAAFKEAEKEMIEIAYLADGLASPGGIIERLLRFCRPDADQDENSHADLYLEQAQEDIDDCTTRMRNIQQKFENWSETTLYLFKALGESQGKKAREAKDVERDIRQSEASKRLQEDELASELRMFESRKESLEKSREQKQFFERLIPVLVSGFPELPKISGLCASFAGSAGSTAAGSAPLFAEMAGVGSATSSTLASLLPFLPQAAISGAIGYCYYSYLKWEVLSMEEAQAKRQAYINKVTENISEFQATLKNLSSETVSIAEITEILKKSVCHLTELQVRVQDFMDVLIQLSRVINRAVKGSRLTIRTAAKSERLVNSAIKQDLRENAFKMKASFNFLLRATEIYVAISTKFITPTIRKFGDLRLYQAGTEADIKEKMEALNQLRLAACDGTDDLAIRMHEELKGDIHEIVANSTLLDH